jgi:hypothetical protein
MEEIQKLPQNLRFLQAHIHFAYGRFGHSFEKMLPPGFTPLSFLRTFPRCQSSLKWARCSALSSNRRSQIRQESPPGPGTCSMGAWRTESKRNISLLSHWALAVNRSSRPNPDFCDKALFDQHEPNPENRTQCLADQIDWGPFRRPAGKATRPLYIFYGRLAHEKQGNDKPPRKRERRLVGDLPYQPPLILVLSLPKTVQNDRSFAHIHIRKSKIPPKKSKSV